MAVLRGAPVALFTAGAPRAECEERLPGNLLRKLLRNAQGIEAVQCAAHIAEEFWDGGGVVCERREGL